MSSSNISVPSSYVSIKSVEGSVFSVDSNSSNFTLSNVFKPENLPVVVFITPVNAYKPLPNNAGPAQNRLDIGPVKTEDNPAEIIPDNVPKATVFIKLF